jgi:DNA primase
MRGRLAIPYLTDAGPVAIVARCIEDHDCKTVPDHSKIAKPSGQGNLLYGVQSVSWAEEWIVATEGEIDALTWQQMGVPAVSIPGAKNWKPHWVNVFEDFSRVHLAEDGDAGGKELWDKMSYELSNAIRMRMPDGEDSNSMFLKSGKEYLLNRIRK